MSTWSRTGVIRFSSLANTCVECAKCRHITSHQGLGTSPALPCISLSIRSVQRATTEQNITSRPGYTLPLLPCVRPSNRGVKCAVTKHPITPWSRPGRSVKSAVTGHHTTSHHVLVTSSALSRVSPGFTPPSRRGRPSS